MTVTLWVVLGIVLVLLGLPLSFYFPVAAYVTGIGLGFLIVWAGQWLWGRWHESPDGEVVPEPD